MDLTSLLGPPRARRAHRRPGLRAWACAAVVVAVALTATAPVGQAEPSQPGPNDIGDLGPSLNEFMASEMARLDVAGAAVVVVRDGETLLSAGYGFADREAQVPVEPATTVFGIGSVSKPLTAVAALQQVEQGNVALATDIDDVLDVPVSDFEGTAVTVGSLLTHTSGFDEGKIGYWTDTADDVGPLGEFETDHVPTRFAATGEVHSYSNHNYGLAGLVVEQASGQDFVDYMDDHVFGPLDMASTSFWHAIPAELESQVATGYGGPPGSRNAIAPVYDHEFPAAAVMSTADDMARFMGALLDGGRADGRQVLGRDTADLYLAPAYRPQPDMPGRTTGGLEEMWINGERAVGHGGDSLAGFAAQMVLLPEHDTGIFVVHNVASDEFRTSVIDAVVGELYPDQTAAPTFVDLDAGELGRFAGTYQWTRFARSAADKVLAMTPPYNTYVDANDDGTLTVRWLGVDERWLYRPTGPTLFERVSGEPAVVDGLVLDPGDLISFTLDDDSGDVTYLHTSLHTVALQKVPFLGLGIVHLSVFGTIVIVFVVSLFVWPIGAFLRRRRNRRRAAHPESSESDQPIQAVATGSPSQSTERNDATGASATGGAWHQQAAVVSNANAAAIGPSVGARAALRLEIGVASGLLLGLAAFFVAVSDSDVAFGPTPALYLAAALITISSIAGLALVPAAVGSWMHGWFTIGGRIFYSLLALTAPVPAVVGDRLEPLRLPVLRRRSLMTRPESPSGRPGGLPLQGILVGGGGGI